MSDVMLFIDNAGDPSVGLHPYHLQINLGDQPELLTDADYRRDVREAAAELGAALTGERCHASFSFELPLEPELPAEDEDELYDDYRDRMAERMPDNSPRD